MADTRKDRRAPVSLKVRFKSATVDEFVEQYAMDISRGGIFIKSKSPMPIGTLLKFEFQLKDESRLIHGVGRVVWKVDGTDAGDKPPGMGIKFIKMDPQSRSLVEQIASQRGDAPGEFEKGRQKIKSAKKTQAFFPAALPRDQLPASEDSTQVRHASEFLAEALSAGDEDAAKEAAETAERARQRTEEIAKEREDAARREKEGLSEEAQAPAAVEPAAAAVEPAAAAVEPAAAAVEPAPEDAAAAEADARARDLAEAKARALDEAEAERREREVAAAPAEEKTTRPPARSTPSTRPAAEATDEEPRSMMLPIVIGVAALVALGYYAWSTQQGDTGGTDEIANIGGQETTGPEPEVLPEDLVADVGVSDAGESAFPEDAVMVAVRVATSPPGATVQIAGEPQDGETPLEIQLPVGHEVEVVVRKDGYISGRQVLTANEGQGPLMYDLEELPWVVAVNVTPPDARVMAGGNSTNDLGEITLSREPGGPVSVTASMRGYSNKTEQVLRPMFQVEGERMLARLTIVLEESSRGRPTMMARPFMMTMAAMDDGGEAAGTGDEPEVGMDPPPTMDSPPTMDDPPPTMETPTMADPPSMDVPDNPF